MGWTPSYGKFIVKAKIEAKVGVTTESEAPWPVLAQKSKIGQCAILDKIRCSDDKYTDTNYGKGFSSFISIFAVKCLAKIVFE